METILLSSIPEEERQLLIRATGDIIIEITDRGEFLRVWGEPLFNMNPWIGKNISEILGNEKVTQFTNGINAILNGESFVEFEYQTITDKSWRLARMVKSEGNKILICFRDITNIKKVDYEFRRINFLLNSIIQNTTDEVHVIDANFNIIVINDRLKDVIKADSGIEVKEGDNILSILEGFNVKDEFSGYFKKVFNGEKLSFRRIYQSLPHEKQGVIKLIYKDYYFDPIYIGGRVEYICIISKDVTDFEDAILDANLQKSNLQAIMDSSVDGIVFFDDKLNFILCNKTFSHYFLKLHNNEIAFNMPIDVLIKEFKFLDDENQKIVSSKIRNTLNGDNDFIAIEYTPDNQQTYYFDLTFSPVYMNDKIIGVNMLASDVTERTLNEIKLKESAERLKFAMDATGEGVWDWDVINDISYHSPGWLKILHINPDTFMSDNQEFSKRLYPDDYDLAWEKLNDILNNKTDFFISEHRMVCDDGKVIWVQDKGKVVERNADGYPIRVVGAVTDISEQRASREALKTSRAYLEAIINTTESAIWLIDTEYNILFMNQAFSKLYESITSKKSQTPFTFSYDDNNIFKAFQPHIDKALTGKPVTFELPIHNGSSTQYFEVIIRPAFYEEHKLLGLSFYCNEITEHKMYEHEILSQKQFIEQVINLVPNLIFVKDAQGRFVLANKAVSKIYAQPIDMIIGKTDAEINPNETEVENFNVIDKKVLEEKITILVPEESVSNPKTGETKWFQTVKVPMVSSSGQAQILGVSTDITERKITEEEKVKLIEELIMKNKNMEQFTYIISHNLRSPVAKILGLTSIMDKENDNADVNKFIINALQTEANNLDGIIQDLNAIINLKSSMEEIKEMIDFTAIFAHVKSLMDREISGVDMLISEDFSECVSAYAIKSYMHSVFLNLLTNAIKYRSSDRRLEIKIRSQRMGEYIKLSFEDNGTGIDLERHRENLFGLFKRFHHHVEGKGMGLHITKTQIEMMGGKIDVDSEPDEGTTFYIYLPEVKS